MKARELCEKHLLREARIRALENLKLAKARPTDVAKAVSAAQAACVDEHVQTSARNAELCAWIVRRFGDEIGSDLIAEIGQRGVWHREVAELARAEGVALEPGHQSLLENPDYGIRGKE